jgi:multiple sugar transport system permease protein
VQLLGFPAQPFFSDPTQAMGINIAVSIWRKLGYVLVIYLAALQTRTAMIVVDTDTSALLRK